MSSEPSVVLLVCQYIKNIMQVLQSKNSGRTLVEEVVGCISTLKMAVSSLNTAHEQAECVIVFIHEL